MSGRTGSIARTPIFSLMRLKAMLTGIVKALCPWRTLTRMSPMAWQPGQSGSDIGKRQENMLTLMDASSSPITSHRQRSKAIFPEQSPLLLSGLAKAMPPLPGGISATSPHVLLKLSYQERENLQGILANCLNLRMESI